MVDMPCFTGHLHAVGVAAQQVDRVPLGAARAQCLHAAQPVRPLPGALAALDGRRHHRLWQWNLPGQLPTGETRSVRHFDSARRARRSVRPVL